MKKIVILIVGLFILGGCATVPCRMYEGVWHVEFFDGTDPQHPKFRFVEGGDRASVWLFVFNVENNELMWAVHGESYPSMSDDMPPTIITYGVVEREEHLRQAHKPLEKNVLYYFYGFPSQRGAVWLGCYFMLVEENGKLIAKEVKRDAKSKWPWN